MATTKKTTTKKATKKTTAPKRRPIDFGQLRKDCDRIFKLRDAMYKKYNNRWQNSYGRDQFDKAISLLNDAAMELGHMY